MDKNIFKDISYGMYLVTTKEAKNVGCIINTLTQITSDNPCISISLNKNNYTNEIIKKTNKFAVSIISQNTDTNIISTFGFKSSKDIDKFENIEYKEIENLPIIEKNMCGYLICKVINIISLDTHDLIIAKVETTKKSNDLIPMTYEFYQTNLKGKSPKKAPTYIESDIDEDEWVCDTCGYVYKGKIPNDFVCPLCGMSREHFKKSKKG